MNRVAFIYFLLMIFFTGQVATANDITKRQGGMKVLKQSMRILVPMMTKKSAYDAVAVRRAATQIKRHSGEAMLKLFPNASLGANSKAAPAIWKNWNEFKSLAMRLETLSAGLAAGADKGLQGKGSLPKKLTPKNVAATSGLEVFKNIGATCGACHKKFRLR